MAQGHRVLLAIKLEIVHARVRKREGDGHA